ncbi:hypothetical protein L1887_20442 [Cichorium endivia]|nr:hypothetical protein L1887_20442 [Cichorium endivia]
MYAVGRLSSYITRGVSTVSGPFHPFGGAIDIVVVQQQDGTLKSSPWYVRFGKFQGVLKAREKVVDINVNGVQADFNMYLNPRGEAYFLRKDMGSEESRSGEPDRDGRCVRPVKSKSMDYNYDHCNSLTDANNSQAFSRNLGFVLERKNIKKEDVVTRKSADSAEIAADLLEMKWSTSLSTKSNKDQEEHNKDDSEFTSGKLEASLVLHEEHFVNKSDNNETVDGIMVTKVDGDGNVEIYEGHGGILENGKEETLKVGSDCSKGQEAVEEPIKLGDGCFTEVACIQQEKVSEDISVVAVSVCKADDEVESPLESNGQLPSNLDHSKSISSYQESDSSPNIFDHVKGMKRNLRRFASDTDIPKCKLMKEESVTHNRSLPNLWVNELDDLSYYSLDPKRRISKWEILRKDASRIMKEGNKPPSGDTKLKDQKDSGDGSGKSWSLWPFTKTKSKRFSENSRKDSEFGCGSEVEGEKDPLTKSGKMRREVTPTSEQLESLNLTAGKNTVTFKFSTAVLGNQQVDARIFLWKWDTRIVISDVDGTITKSDVLGQFMPLVGRDWSHIGVTHLFSAIKENGYEILFLSARSISQADITRQFLINLRQEGKSLPEGPVVISPDGLFPSLFREVIRRAPHEFKIACLADIRACFPEDWNPFYAGFGNRDTDEFSYLKVGIPKGKIFIINPKGEVVVNRCHDTKSYSSLHSIVNGIFPPTFEKEEVDNTVS